MEYTWNSRTNAFDGYEPQYETKIDAQGNEIEVLIVPSVKVYTKAEVDRLLNNRPAGTVVKDVDGTPMVVKYEVKNASIIH